MKKFFLLIAVMILLTILPVALAQDSSDKEGCDLPLIQENVDHFLSELGTLKTSTETDPAKLADALQELANGANALRAKCDGLSFSGKEPKVFGPVVIPAGIYRAIATTKGYFIVDVSALDGECGEGTKRLSESVFLISAGDADNGAEVVFTSKGCTALIETSNTSEDWKLEFVRISTS